MAYIRVLIYQDTYLQKKILSKKKFKKPKRQFKTKRNNTKMDKFINKVL